MDHHLEGILEWEMLIHRCHSKVDNIHTLNKWDNHPIKANKEEILNNTRTCQEMFVNPLSYFYMLRETIHANAVLV